ncbi:MAG: hypothetical protein DME55_02495 [Verrucomicrobia bacterium]|nr:MAG: hypothetical protein DME55_02495 [Verrucomicrobiota bacterium]
MSNAWALLFLFLLVLMVAALNNDEARMTNDKGMTKLECRIHVAGPGVARASSRVGDCGIKRAYNERAQSSQSLSS